jgi:hypothetical protein
VKRRAGGSQTCNVWNGKFYLWRIEDALTNRCRVFNAENFGLINPRGFTTGYLLFAPSAQGRNFLKPNLNFQFRVLLFKHYCTGFAEVHFIPDLWQISFDDCSANQK